jgi:cytochrome oxidase Cu insertion factor (SCO1/SenC/PrrC family)
MRREHLWTFGLFLLLAVALAVALWTVADRNPRAPAIGQAASEVIGEAAPEIDGEDLDRKAFKLSDYRGKVVLLDFWGHW